MAIELRRVPLKSCKQCPNRDMRDENNENGLCGLNPSSLDNLPLRCVGEWANDKIYYLVQYFGIFSVGMKEKWDLRYLEICSGPGRCSTRDGYEQDGTALAIINHPAFKYIRDAIFIDHDSEAVRILNQRIENDGQRAKATAYIGDYNDSSSICSKLINDFSGLTLCLIDPTDCSVPFSTIQDIYTSCSGKCDFIVSIFDKSDFNRNAVNVTLDPKYKNLREKYEQFLGDEAFFNRPDIVMNAQANNCAYIREQFNSRYGERLSELGLSHQGKISISTYYHLLFVSSHRLGLEFWKKSSKYNRQGQADLFSM